MNAIRIETATSCFTHYRKSETEFNKKRYPMRVCSLFCFSSFFLRKHSFTCVSYAMQESEIVKKKKEAAIQRGKRKRSTAMTETEEKKIRMIEFMFPECGPLRRPNFTVHYLDRNLDAK